MRSRYPRRRKRMQVKQHMQKGGMVTVHLVKEDVVDIQWNTTQPYKRMKNAIFCNRETLHC